MTELQLYKFIQENGIEIDWHGKQLIIWIDFRSLEEFTKLLDYNYLADGGMEVALMQDGIAFDLVPLCEYFGIEPMNILGRGDD